MCEFLFNPNTLDPLIVASSDWSEVNAMVRVAVKMDIIMIPTNIHRSPQIRPGIDRGERSPYLVQIIVNM